MRQKQKNSDAMKARPGPSQQQRVAKKKLHRKQMNSVEKARAIYERIQNEKRQAKEKQLAEKEERRKAQKKYELELVSTTIYMHLQTQKTTTHRTTCIHGTYQTRTTELQQTDQMPFDEDTEKDLVILCALIIDLCLP